MNQANLFKIFVALAATFMCAACGTPSGVPATAEEFDTLRTQKFSVEANQPIDIVYEHLEKQFNKCFAKSRVMPVPGPIYLGEFYIVPRQSTGEEKYQLLLAYRGDRKYMAIRVRLTALDAYKTRVNVAARLPVDQERERIIKEWVVNNSEKCSSLF